MGCAGPDHLDVPGSSERPCRVTLLALAEGAAAATITLRNQATGEHMFWTLAYSAAPAPVRHEKNKLYNNENLMSWDRNPCFAVQQSSMPCHLSHTIAITAIFECMHDSNWRCLFQVCMWPLNLLGDHSIQGHHVGTPGLVLCWSARCGARQQQYLAWPPPSWRRCLLLSPATTLG